MLELAKVERGHFCTVWFVRKTFFEDLCFISIYIVYRIHFQNIHSITHQNTLLHTLFCLFLKSSEASRVSLSCDVGKAFEIPF